MCVDKMATKAREDTGLLNGAEALRQQDLLYDYTLKVGNQEFRVHKFMLATVSDFFRDLFCKKGVNDTFEVTEFSAEHISTLIQFIYTGDESLIRRPRQEVHFYSSHQPDNKPPEKPTYPKEMLECGVYFQMPKVIKESADALIDTLNCSNANELLSTFTRFSMDDEAQKVKDYMKEHGSWVKSSIKADKMSLEGLQVLLDNWKDTEIDMYEYIVSWGNADYNNRKKHMNDFLGRVRYSLMSPQEIATIKAQREYREGNGAWKHLVNKASMYTMQPVMLRACDDSEQNKVRDTKTVLLFSKGPNSPDTANTYVLGKDKWNANLWKPCLQIQPPPAPGKIGFVLEVNNFVVTCSQFGIRQDWHILDLHSQTWTQMASLPQPRDEFAMVYHDKHLYVLGGSLAGGGNQKYVTDTVQRYSFQANTWSPGIKLPVAVKNHGACVHKGAIYISGGEVVTRGGPCQTDRMDRLVLSSQKWECRAPLSMKIAHHKMSVMVLEGQEVIVVMGKDLKIRYYNPRTDKWMLCQFRLRQHRGGYTEDPEDMAVRDVKQLQWRNDSMVLYAGNTVFLLNLYGLVVPSLDDCVEPDYDPYDETLKPRNDICVKWKINPQKQEIWELTTYNFPIRPRSTTHPVNAIAAVLAFPEEENVRDPEFRIRPMDRQAREEAAGPEHWTAALYRSLHGAAGGLV